MTTAIYFTFCYICTTAYESNVHNNNADKTLPTAKVIYFYSLLLLNILLPSYAFSDEFYSLSLQDLMQVEVGTASKKHQKVSEAPAMVYVISAQEINERGYSNLKDIFHDLPGMGVHENYFAEEGSLVAVRGIAGNNKIITLIDGIRINPPGNENLPLRSDISIRAARQIEIIYGPGSTLHGNDAISMVVNVITKKPGNKWHLDTQVIAGAGNVSGDSGQHKEAYVSFGRRFGEDNSDFSLNGFFQWQNAELDDYKDTFPQWYQLYEKRDGGLTADITRGTDRKDNGLNFMLKVQSGNGSLSLWHRDSERNSGDGGYTPVLQMVPQALWRDSSTVIEAKHLFMPTAHIELESSLTASRYEINPKSRYVFNPSPQTPLFLRDWKYGEGKSLRLDERLSWKPNDNLSIIGGVTLAWKNILPKATVDRGDEAGFDANISGLDRSLDILGQGQNFTWYDRVDGEVKAFSVSNYTLYIYQTSAAFAESQWHFNDNIQLVGGIRIDSDSRFDKRPISPRLALIYDASKKITIKAIATKAFVNPAPYFNFTSYNGTNINLPNPNLQPELARSLELNTTYTTSQLLLGLSLYRNEQDKILFSSDEGLPFQLLRDSTGRVAPPVWLDEQLSIPIGISQSANGGHGDSSGTDLYLKYNNDYGSFWSSYSYVEYNVTIAGKKSKGLDSLASNHVRLGATMRFLNDKLTTTISGNWRSSLTPIDGNTAGLDNYIDDPVSWNLFAQYQWNPQTHFTLTIKNLLNKRYALKGILSPTPQERAKVLLGIKYSL